MYAFSDLPDQSLWLGGNDLALEGDWRWESDNSVIVFENWYGDEPDDANGGEDCLFINSFDPRFTDGTCTVALTFFCEWTV